MRLQVLILLASFVITANLLAFGQRDFQVTIGSEKLSEIVENAAQNISAGSNISLESGSFLPVLQIKDGYAIVRFLYNGKPSFACFDFAASNNVIKISVLHITCGSMDVTVLAGGKLCDKLVELINTSKDFSASRRVRVITVQLVNNIVPGMSDVMIQRVKLSENCLTIASTRDIVANNQGDLQGYIGLDVVKNALSKLLTTNNSSDVEVKGFELDLKKSNAGLNLTVGDDTKVNISLDIKRAFDGLVEVGLNAVSAISNGEELSTEESAELIGNIVSLINNNLKRMDVKTDDGKLVQLNYETSESITFNIDFRNILKLSITPEICSLNIENGYAGLTAGIN